MFFLLNIIFIPILRRLVNNLPPIAGEIFALLSNYIPLYIGISLILLWSFITYFYIKKALSYVDEVVYASDVLLNDRDKEIVMSYDLSYIEKQMNKIREKNLNAENAALDAEKKKNELVLYLAHDLKTPLTSVIAYIDLLKNQKNISDELREKYLDIVFNKAQRLEDLINEFFEISRFNIVNMELDISNIDLSLLLLQLQAEFQPMMKEKNIKLIIDAPPKLMIKADGGKIQRVFENILRNAVFYSYENSDITISVKINLNNITVSVRNYGATINKDKLARIFDKFYRLDEARSTNSGGAGLGLAIAKEIVKLHNGEIYAVSKDECTEFYVVLPLSI